MRLFRRIFFSFWIATVLMIAFLLSVSELLPLTSPGDRVTRFEPQLAASALTKAVNAYEQRGPSAFPSELQSQLEIRHSSACLFNQAGEALVETGGTPSVYASMARDVLQSGRAQLVRFSFRLLYACPLQSVSGRHYVAVLSIFEPISRLLNPRLWFNLTLAMLPASLVCLVLTLYLTRPITRLRAAAQRLAGGELDARAAPPRMARRDELGDLARDFDLMAAQIQLLMTAQRRFVADVSHELGAPLTRMHLALALLRRQFPEKGSEALARIERETGKLSDLVQQLLLLAGLEAGRVPAETSAPVSMLALCESIIEDANFEAAHANCRITGSRQELTILAYPNLLRRAIDNVLRNAIRYAPAGSEIELDCKADLIQQEVTVDICDRGPGVPDAMLVDIFRPFFRTENGRERISGGTGLGLAIASEAVRMHDGTISARNRKSGGLQVTITLPVRTPRDEDAPQDEEQA